MIWFFETHQKGRKFGLVAVAGARVKLVESTRSQDAILSCIGYHTGNEFGFDDVLTSLCAKMRFVETRFEF